MDRNAAATASVAVCVVMRFSIDPKKIVKGGPFTEISKYFHPDCGLNLDRNATATAVRTLRISLMVSCVFQKKGTYKLTFSENNEIFWKIRARAVI